MSVIYAGLMPIIGKTYALVSATAQLLETAIVALIFIKALESEIAVIGPETAKRFLGKLKRKRRKPF